MKKIVLIQNDDGTMELDGNPVESAEDAIEQIKMSVIPEGEAEVETEGEPTESDAPEDEEITPESAVKEAESDPMESEEIGKTLQSKMPTVDKKKMGMRPKMKASFEDYGI